MAAVDFLHHDNPSTWAGVEPATLGTEAQWVERWTSNPVMGSNPAWDGLISEDEDKSGSGPAMEESENDVGSLEQLLLYADEHYLAGKLPLEDHLG
ncbi:hypothetical protein TNCV_1995081 [Trichonephila clavipes]|nr:hypothetical protein TNCV_1995081 [Trichonephila clavipes]